jgi:hypothetical protein
MKEKEDGRKNTSGFWHKQLSVDGDGTHLWCGEANESPRERVLDRGLNCCWGNLALSGILSLLAVQELQT